MGAALSLLALTLGAFASAAEPQPLKPLPAASEVTASSGSVQLILRVYQTTIPIKEGFWYQLEIKNIGKEPLPILDRLMFNPSWLYWDANSRGIVTLEVRKPDGTVLRAPWPPVPDPEGEDYLDEHLPREPYVKETPDVVEFRQTLRTQGFPDSEVRKRLLKYQSEKNSQRHRNIRPSRILQPGESIITPPWVNRKYNYAARAFERDQRPMGQFAEADVFSWPKPGTYRVRAVYDHQTKDYDRSVFVTVKTPWVPLHVK